MHWSQQMSAAINGEASRNITRKASKMVDNANTAQRHVSAGIHSGEDFSHQLAQVIANCDNFDQTIMGLDIVQNDDYPNRESQHEMEPGVSIVESLPRDFTPLILN